MTNNKIYKAFSFNTDGTDPQRLTDILNDGWEIVRTDASGASDDIVYIFVKEKYDKQ